MNSKIARAGRVFAHLAFYAALSTNLVGCGLFGSKAPKDSAIDYGDGATGCLNNLGPQFERYFKGEVSIADWQTVFTCADDALGQFRRFVRGSDNGNYTRADMRAFIGQFLVTNQPITEALVGSAFELKASVFGGSDQAVTPAELDRFQSLMKVVSNDSAALIPHLFNRIHNPSATNLFALATAVEQFAGRLAVEIGSSGTRTFPRASVETLANEVSRIAQFTVPDGFSYWMMAGKALLLGGTDQHMEPTWWPRAIRMAGVYGGVAAAVVSANLDGMTGPNEKGEFLMAVGRRAHAGLRQSIGFHGTAIPFARIHKLLDTLPASWLPIPALVIKQVLAPFVINLAGGQTTNAFDLAALNTILDRAEFWTRGQTHIEKIFSRLGNDPMGVTVTRFKDEAAAYSVPLGPRDKTEVNRLVFLAENFMPMFREGENELTLDPHWVGRTKQQLTHLHWIRIAVERLLGGYSTHPDRDKGLLGDFKTVLLHWNPLLSHFRKSDPRKYDQLHMERYRDANLFMPCSDGNNYVDINEGTYYIAFLLSAGVGAGRFSSNVAAHCRNLGFDQWGGETYDPDCYRRELFGERETYWARFPKFLAFYNALRPQDQLMIDQAIEQAARVGGYSDKPVSYFDLDGSIGIVHYVENMFQRFDGNKNQKLNLSETLGAFPIFRQTIAEIGKIDPNKTGMLEAVFTYIVKYGRIPDQSNVSSMVHFLGWWAWRPFWTINGDRRSLYKVIAMLATPPAP
jgi:hypothetical protein